MEWFGFWLFMAVLVACDHWIFSQGYDSILQYHKTDAEKELQRLKIERLRLKGITCVDLTKPIGSREDA